MWKRRLLSLLRAFKKLFTKRPEEKWFPIPTSLCWVCKSEEIMEITNREVLIPNVPTLAERQPSPSHRSFYCPHCHAFWYGTTVRPTNL